MKRDSTIQCLSRTPRLFLCLIAERRYVILRHGAVLARLWRLRFSRSEASLPRACAEARREGNVYAIDLKGLGARRFCLLPGDEARARDIFSLVVRNTVTPCGLRDVLEEL